MGAVSIVLESLRWDLQAGLAVLGLHAYSYLEQLEMWEMRGGWVEKSEDEMLLVLMGRVVQLQALG